MCQPVPTAKLLGRLRRSVPAGSVDRSLRKTYALSRPVAS